MKVTPTAIPEVLILEPQVFGDDRGFFFESYNARKFEQLTGSAAMDRNALTAFHAWRV